MVPTPKAIEDLQLSQFVVLKAAQGEHLKVVSSLIASTSGEHLQGEDRPSMRAAEFL